MASKIQKATRFCGTCQHYSWTLGNQRKTTCNNLGCIDTTPSCVDYSINPFVLQDFEKVLKPLADVLRVMPITTLSMFYEIMTQEKSLRRKGYYFMEKVAVKYWGTPAQKFVSNYVIAHVYSATNEGVFVIAKSGMRVFALKESVIKLELFLDVRRSLKESGKVLDPSIAASASMKQKLAVTETLDDIIARGMIDEEDLDSDIKRKLNPKRIHASMHSDAVKARSTATSMSTQRRKPIEQDEIQDAEYTPIETAKKGKLKKKPSQVLEPLMPPVEVKKEKILTGFALLKQKMAAKKRKDGGNGK